LAAYGSLGYVIFTVNPDGTISYAQALQGVLSGQGTNQLTVLGAKISINASALTPGQVALDYEPYQSNATLIQATVMPGTHELAGYGSLGYVIFTVNTDGSISFASNYSKFLSVQNNNELIVNGASVTVNATALAGPTLTVDEQTVEKTAAAFILSLMPGTHVLSDATGSVTFTVNFDGSISFPASEDNLLSLQGSMTLIVKALS
jgi:hypothetical protein